MWALGQARTEFWTSNRARIFKRLWSSGIDSKELIPPAYIAWRFLAPIDSLKNSSSDYSLTLLVLYKELYLHQKISSHVVLYVITHAYMSYSLLMLLSSSNRGFPLSFKGTVSRDGYFFELPIIFISIFCVCADVFEFFQKLFTTLYKYLLFICFFEITF